ncbi:hypothetical protein HY504_02345, partial [Candidatus Wolfebacteria bacterium]|nr:hypothetical protein [Candidatus Wolfebacteria bacterium]
KLIPSLNPRSDIKIYIIDDFSRREAMSEVVLDAMIEAMEDKDFRRELSYYIKPSTTRSPVGMPGSTINIPLPLSYVASTVIRNLNTGRFQRKQDEPLLKKFTPLFIIIATEDDSPEAWIETGRIYERIALESARRNISTHPMAAAIQIGNFYKELQRLLETSYRPQMFFRMGFAKTQPPHSPRLTPTDVCDMKI